MIKRWCKLCIDWVGYCDHITDAPKQRVVSESLVEQPTWAAPDKPKHRISMIPSITRILSGPKVETNIHCVGCDRIITEPGLSRTGSVLNAMVTWIDKIDYTLLGDEIIQRIRRIGFHTYRKGFLCDKCASCYTTVPDKHGVRIPLVKIDDLHPVRRDPEQIAYSKPRRLNTRYTQGKKGARV